MSKSSERHKHIPLSQTEFVPGTASARISSVRHLPEVMRAFGVDFDEVLATARVRPELFRDPDNQIAYVDLGRLLQICEQRSNCDHLGLLVARQTHLADLGLAGKIALCGSTAGEGLQSFVDHFSLHSSATTTSLITSGGYARFVWAIAAEGMIDTAAMQLAAMTTAFNVLKELFGKDWLPAVVTLACRSPASARPVQRFFRAPLRFDSDESAIVFDRQWLDKPLPPVDPDVRREVEAAVRAQRAAILVDFPATVRRLLRKQLIIGDCSMDDVAAILDMHRRTLHRRLSRDGVEFRELVDSVKGDIARQLLRDTGMEIQQIAEALRFSSAANFATAFRRWTGVTPSTYRRSSLETMQDE